MPESFPYQLNMPSGDGIFKNLPGDFFWVSKAVAMSGVLPQPLSVGLSLIWSPEGLVLVIQGQGLLAEVPEGPLQRSLKVPCRAGGGGSGEGLGDLGEQSPGSDPHQLCDPGQVTGCP